MLVRVGPAECRAEPLSDKEPIPVPTSPISAFALHAFATLAELACERLSSTLVL